MDISEKRAVRDGMNAFSGKTCLMAFPEENAAYRLKELLASLDVEIAGTVSSVPDIRSFLLRRECDFVFASIFLPMLPADGIEGGIFSLPLYKRPAVLYFAPENAGSLMLSAYSPVVTLPTDAETLKAKMQAVYPVPVRDADCRKAENILSRMGFEDVSARKYLSFACALSANDMNAARLLRRNVYPALSKAFGVSETKIADGMRRIIDKTFLSGDIESQYRLFGSSIDETRGKPTVSQLIAVVGEMIRTGKNA